MDDLTGGVHAGEAVSAAIGSVGLHADAGPPSSGADLAVEVPGSPPLLISVKATSLISLDSAPGQLRRWSAGARTDATPVAVSSRITADARAYLSHEGWSWLDLRGHLRLTAPGLFIDTRVPAILDPGPARAGFTGKVSVELAVLLLFDPQRTVGVRAAATALSRAPSSVSEALGALRAAGLVDGRGRPAVPELFSELAANWKPTTVDVEQLPQPGRGRENAVLRLGLDEVESSTGWALTDTVAAALYGAPVAARADHPRDFYVPDGATLRRATQLLGSAASPEHRAGTVRLAPVPAVCTRRVDATTWSNESWPLTQPLFVALDLAQDPGRGREVLQGWTPEEPWHRVW